MTKTIEQTDWKSFLRTFSEQNEGKPTRIGIFVPSDGSLDDYWIGDGLPLMGVDVYQDRGQTRIDILFENFSHSIERAQKVVSINGDGVESGLDISDVHGATTLLRLEDWKTQ